MKELVLVGAGGFGREVYAWARQCSEFGKDWTIKGFLDDDPSCLDSYGMSSLWLGTIGDWQPSPSETFVCSIGQTQPKENCVKSLEAKGAVFTSLVHPSCVLGDRVQLGAGVILCPFVTLTCDIFIDDHCALNIGCSVGHDAVLGKYCQLQSRVAINGAVSVGRGVLMGTHATILPGRKIGDFATVGMGSVAYLDVPEGVTVLGNPARAIYSKGDR